MVSYHNIGENKLIQEYSAARDAPMHDFFIQNQKTPPRGCLVLLFVVLRAEIFRILRVAHKRAVPLFRTGKGEQDHQSRADDE